MWPFCYHQALKGLKRVFQENKWRQISRKTNISYPLIHARTHLETTVLRFTLLPFYWQFFLGNIMQCNQGTKIKNKVLQESIEFKQNLELEKKFYFCAILSLRHEIPFFEARLDTRIFFKQFCNFRYLTLCFVGWWWF